MKENTTETLKLLGNLLTEEFPVYYDGYKVVHDKYEKLYEKVTQSLYKKINDTLYENKTDLIIEIEKTLDRIQFCIQFPQIINKSVLLIYGDAWETGNFISKVSTKNTGQYFKLNNNIPSLIVHNDEENVIRSINQLDNIADLSFAQYRKANKDLYKKDIDIRQLLSMYQLQIDIQFSNLVMMYMPNYVRKNTKVYTMMQQMADCTVLLADKKGKWKSDLGKMQKFEKFEKIYVLFESEELMESVDNNEGIQFETYDQFLQKMNDLNEYRFNTGFENLFRNSFMDYFVEMKQKITHLNHLTNGLSKDLLKVSDEEMADKLRYIRKSIRKQLDSEKKAHLQVEKLLNECIDAVNKIEDYLFTEVVKEEPANAASEYIKTILSDYTLKCIDAENYKDASQYIQQLASWGSVTTSYLMMYLKLHKGKKLTKTDKILFTKRPSNNFLFSRVFLKAFLQIDASKELFDQLEEEFCYSQDAQVLFELGMAAQALQVFDKAKQYFRKAVVKRHQEAGVYYLDYVEDSDIREIERIANLLIPEANYLAGMYYLDDNRFAKGVTYLKIAAAFKHVEAIEKISEIEFGRYLKVRKHNREEATEILDNAILLHQFVLKEQPNNKDTKERLGKLYYWDENYRQAEEILSTCSTGEAKFLCGKIYQYGDGFAQDLEKAKRFFTEAKRLGHRQAEVELRKVEGWIQSNSIKHQYNSSHSYESTSYSTSSSSSRRSGCFLTTATCLALEKQDNCEEIVAYKDYRDNILAKDPDGEALIIEYYRIAPIIVEKIDAKPNRKEIYLNLYDQYIKPGYDYLQNNYIDMAKKTYIEMVKALCEEYEVRPFDK